MIERCSPEDPHIAMAPTKRGEYVRYEDHLREVGQLEMTIEAKIGELRIARDDNVTYTKRIAELSQAHTDAYTERLETCKADVDAAAAAIREAERERLGQRIAELYEKENYSPEYVQALNDVMALFGGNDDEDG